MGGRVGEWESLHPFTHPRLRPLSASLSSALGRQRRRRLGAAVHDVLGLDCLTNVAHGGAGIMHAHRVVTDVEADFANDSVGFPLGDFAGLVAAGDEAHVVALMAHPLAS